MQTAIEWLYDKWSNCKEWKWEEIEQWFEQAKEMEKQQIIDAREDGIKDAIWFNSEMELGRNGEPKMSEQYYNETYGSKGSDDHIELLEHYEFYLDNLQDNEIPLSFEFWKNEYKNELNKIIKSLKTN